MVQYLVNQFLTDKQAMVDEGELSERLWKDYKSTCAYVVKVFGKSRIFETITANDLKGIRRHLSNDAAR